jgi:hypothetical protein
MYNALDDLRLAMTEGGSIASGKVNTAALTNPTNIPDGSHVEFDNSIVILARICVEPP